MAIRLEVQYKGGIESRCVFLWGREFHIIGYWRELGEVLDEKFLVLFDILALHNFEDVEELLQALHKGMKYLSNSKQEFVPADAANLMIERAEQAIKILEKALENWDNVTAVIMG